MTTANNKAYVTTGKPQIKGAVYWAPAATILPTDAKTALAAAFKCLGYVTEGGLTNSPNRETNTINEWGGGVVYTPLSKTTDSYKFKLIEVMNSEVLKFIYGEDQVTGDLATLLKVEHKDVDLPSCVLVFDMVLNGDYYQRKIIPYATLTTVGDIVYNGAEVVGFDCTVVGIKDTDGRSCIDLIEKAPTV